MTDNDDAKTEIKDEVKSQSGAGSVSGFGTAKKVSLVPRENYEERKDILYNIMLLPINTS